MNTEWTYGDIKNRVVKVLAISICIPKTENQVRIPPPPSIIRTISYNRFVGGMDPDTSKKTTDIGSNKLGTRLSSTSRLGWDVRLIVALNIAAIPKRLKDDVTCGMWRRNAGSEFQQFSSTIVMKVSYNLRSQGCTLGPCTLLQAGATHTMNIVRTW